MTRREFETLRAEVDRLRSYRSPEDLTEIEVRDGRLVFDVQHLGDWELPDDVDDDEEDFDWKVPTHATIARLNALVKRYPGATWFDQGEKCWIQFSAPETK